MNTVRLSNQSVIPSKIVCIGRNYVDHIEELGNAIPDSMVVFMKPNSSITETLMAFQGEQLHYEAEICFLCEGSRFAAVAFGLDLTKRALQNNLRHQGLPWERAKAFDGSALFSEFSPIDGIENPFSITLAINGTTVQSSTSTHMIYSPATILSELQQFTTLNDGDIVMTGTPSGVGTISRGDVFSGTVSRLGIVQAAAEWKAE